MKDSKGSLVLLILGGFLAIRIGANLVRLYRAGGRVEEAKKHLAAVTEQNIQLKQQLQEVQTPLYMEREARDKLGYGKAGEVVVVIPEEELQQISLKQTDKGTDTDPNWIKWRKLYLRK